jgi:hypothetical protein
VRANATIAQQGNHAMTAERKTRTITLTSRPPVKIAEDSWPMVASASDKEFDNQYEFQSNRKSTWFVGVRQHEDGRAIVYARYSYDSNWQNARCYSAARGVLLTAESATTEGICQSIEEVCRDIANAEHQGDDADRWPTLAAECIADMPAEEL